MRMRAAAFFSVLLVAPVLGLDANLESTSTLTYDAEGAKTRPVTKVVTLLKDMAKQMEKEQDADEDIYDKIMCWGITNTKEKTKAIADGKDKIADLTTKIEQLTALSAQTTTEVGDLKEEKAADELALAEATELRAKQYKEFNAQEKESLETILLLAKALVVLDEKSGGAHVQGKDKGEGGAYKGSEKTMKAQVSGFLQVSTLGGSVAGVRTLESLLQDPHLVGVLTPSARRTLIAFMKDESLIQTRGTPGGAYAAQGGEIFGILSQMKETFENNLSQAQKEEADDQRAFDKLKAAKEQEMQTEQDQIDGKTQLLADTDEKTAQAKQDLEATKLAVASDENFLAELKVHVEETEAEYQKRSKTRQAELGAVQKALEILTGDDAHDLFSKTLGFVQERSSAHSERRTQASKVLAAVAGKTRNPRLVTLAVAVRLDAFGKVKKAIDDMVTELRKEKADEIKQKDFCVDEFDKNFLKTEAKIRDKKDVLALIADLKGSIATLKGEINALQGEIDEMNKQLAKEGENRDKSNKDFKMTVSDQRATQKLLKAAVDVLKGFYKKQAAAALVETQAHGGPPPPPGFGGSADGSNKYKKNDSAGGLLAMIEQIITDSKALEAEATRDEKAAKKAYDAFVKDTNDSIDTRQKEIGNKTKIKSEKETNLVSAQKDRASILLELEQFSIQKADLHSSCDFVVKNFEVRQAARDQEIEALKQAKAILSGAKFEALLQSA